MPGVCHDCLPGDGCERPGCSPVGRVPETAEERQRQKVQRNATRAVRLGARSGFVRDRVRPAGTGLLRLAGAGVLRLPGPAISIIGAPILLSPLLFFEYTSFIDKFASPGLTSGFANCGLLCEHPSVFFKSCLQRPG